MVLRRDRTRQTASRRWRRVLGGTVLFVLVVAAAAGHSTYSPGPAGLWTLTDPIDSHQQTDLPWNTRSHWLQPWRGYLDTVPAQTLRSGVGINFNVTAAQAPATAALLARNGFVRARIDSEWSLMSYADPTRLGDASLFDAKLRALRANHIRPLVLLNANSGAPVPRLAFMGHITLPVVPGSRVVHVDPETARQIVPGLTGFDQPQGPAARVLALSVSADDSVRLSQPIPVALLPGNYAMSTLRYAPFAPPESAGGKPNSLFEQSLSGWLAYVKAITAETRRVLGSDHYDVEIWNELSFGSEFLDAANYYQPLPSAFRGTGSVTAAIAARTVAWLRDAANHVGNIGIGDGFANQTPFAAGSTEPAGITAIDKHPYYGGVKNFPGAATDGGDIRPVDALGRPDGHENASGRWVDDFIPSYRSFFPEYFLSGIQTETMVRDLSPNVSYIGSVAHGRDTKPPGTVTAPQVWITETNIHPDGGTGMITPGQKRRLQAKSALRILTAFIDKGVSAVYFYAVGDDDFAMVDPSAANGGETIAAVHRLVDAMAGPDRIATPRSLSLRAITSTTDEYQFTGDGTPAHPNLSNRDVTAFLPFQTGSNRFVVSCYVMTRDMSRAYNSLSIFDTGRFDLPPENYRFTIAGVHGDSLRVSATDPLTGESVPATILSHTAGSAVVQMPLTDSPRLLTLQD